MEFTYCKLNDVLKKMHSGGTPSTEIKSYWDGDIKWLSSGETSQRFIYDTINKITELGVKKSSTKLATKYSVVMACAGQGKTRGQTSFLLDDMYINQSVIAMQANSKVLPLYLFYNLSNRYKELRGGSDASSTRGSITTAKLKKISFKYPNITIQSKITTFLNNYDKLIENNNKRIKILEDMSESIYKEWFVRFRFPGYEKVEKKKSELGMIPTNFEVIKINELIDYYVGGGWGNDDYSEDYSIAAFVIRGADFPAIVKSDVSTCPYRYHKISNYKPRKLKENDIVFEISGGTAEQPVGRAVLITKGILDQLDDKVICASFCKLIRPKYDRVKPHYFYQWLKFLYDTRMIERFQLQSTGIINFKFEYFLRKGSVVVPPTDLVNKYEKLVAPMRDEIDKLSVLNSYLKRQRDLLLPRLMSGKLEVK